jgi:hypothetical protein
MRTIYAKFVKVKQSPIGEEVVNHNIGVIEDGINFIRGGVKIEFMKSHGLLLNHDSLLLFKFPNLNLKSIKMEKGMKLKDQRTNSI